MASSTCGISVGGYCKNKEVGASAVPYFPFMYLNMTSLRISGTRKLSYAHVMSSTKQDSEDFNTIGAPMWFH